MTNTFPAWSDLEPVHKCIACGTSIIGIRCLRAMVRCAIPIEDWDEDAPAPYDQVDLDELGNLINRMLDTSNAL